MHKNPFPDGGFVLHKIPGIVKNYVSAWFDKDGNLKAAEYKRRFCDYPVKENGPTWKKLEKLGPIWKDAGPKWQNKLQ